jgi:hypothetical protein
MMLLQDLTNLCFNLGLLIRGIIGPDSSRVSEFPLRKLCPGLRSRYGDHVEQ